jgi:hypothetical protein
MNKTKITLLTQFLLICLISTFSCIDRNNPWDPVNGCPEEIKNKIIKSVKTKLDSSAIVINQIMASIQIIENNHSLYKKNIQTIEANNVSIQEQNALLHAKNDSIKKFNNMVDCKNLETIQPFSTIDTMPYDYLNLNSIKSTISSESLKIISTIAESNEQCPPAGIFSQKQRDSILLPITNSNAKCSILTKNFEEDFNELVIKNQVFTVHSNEIIAKNISIRQYNDSINKVKLLCNISTIANNDSLQNKFNDFHVKPGDTLYLAPISFRHIRIQNFGNDLKRTFIIGTTDASNRRTSFDSSDCYLTEARNICFINISFSNSRSPKENRICGIRIFDQSKVFFKNCEFAYNDSFGIESNTSYVTLENCSVHHNHVGVKTVGNNNLYVTFDANNVLFAHNKHAAIDANTVRLKVDGCTFSDNNKYGIQFKSDFFTSNISRSIFSFNDSNGLYCEPASGNSNNIFLNTCDFYENNYGDINDPSMKIQLDSSSLKLNPGYIDKSNLNYRLQGTSPLYGKDIGYKYPD